MPRAKIPVSNRSDEETDEPLIANDRNYYKVEKWTKEGSKVERVLYAGSNLDKAQEAFAAAIYHRPRIRLTVRQRSRRHSCDKRLGFSPGGGVRKKPPKNRRFPPRKNLAFWARLLRTKIRLYFPTILW
jgi:hypothetical protein